MCRQAIRRTSSILLVIMMLMASASWMPAATSPVITIVVSPGNCSVIPGGTLRFWARRYTDGVLSLNYPSVTWSASAGQINTSGLFKAPLTPPPGGHATITATYAFTGGTAVGTLDVALSPVQALPVPLVTGAPESLAYPGGVSLSWMRGDTDYLDRRITGTFRGERRINGVSEAIEMTPWYMENLDHVTVVNDGYNTSGLNMGGWVSSGTFNNLAPNLPNGFIADGTPVSLPVLDGWFNLPYDITIPAVNRHGGAQLYFRGTINVRLDRIYHVQERLENNARDVGTNWILKYSDLLYSAQLAGGEALPPGDWDGCEDMDDSYGGDYASRDAYAAWSLQRFNQTSFVWSPRDSLKLVSSDPTTGTRTLRIMNDGDHGVITVRGTYEGYTYPIRIQVATPLPAKSNPLADLCARQGNTICPLPLGLFTPHKSTIDNLQLSYVHTGTDSAFAAPQGPCTSCGDGGGAGRNTLPSLRIERIHRYKDIDRHASFGPGVFLAYDTSLMLTAGSQPVVEFFDPGMAGIVTLKPDGQGVFMDQGTGTLQSLILYADGARTQPIADPALAQAATASDFAGNAWDFEVFPTDDGGVNRVGRLTRIRDRNGNAITIVYSVANPRASLAALGGDRQQSWKIATITDAYGRVASPFYQRDSGQYVISSMTLPDGARMTYGYGVHGLASPLVGLNAVTFPNGDLSLFSTGCDLATGYQYVDFDDAGGEGSHRKKRAYFSAAVGDDGNPQPCNRIRMVTDGNGDLSYRNWFQYDHVTKNVYVFEGGLSSSLGGRMLRFDTLDGIPVRSWLATRWDLTSPLAPDAATHFTWETVESYAADSQNRLTLQKDARNQDRQMIRDGRTGAITGTIITNADGTRYSSRSTTYAPFGLPDTETDTLSRVTRHTYDAHGNRTSLRMQPDTDGESSNTWTYWDAPLPPGLVKTFTDANRNTTRYDYHANGLLHVITQPPDVAGGPCATQTHAYDAAGRLQSVTDAANHAITYQYDQRGRLAAILYADATRETRVYGNSADGTANALIRTTDRNGNVTRFAYDKAGRQVSRTVCRSFSSLADEVERYWYLPGTDQRTRVLVNGRGTDYAFDHRMRLKSITTYPTRFVPQTTTMTYDDLGRVVRKDRFHARGMTSAIFHLYDRMDQVVRTVTELIPGSVSADVPATFPEMETHLADLPRLQDTGANPGYIIEDAVYDTEGQRRAAIDANGYASTFAYDGQGRLIAEVTADTRDGIPQADASRTTYAHDPQGNLTEVRGPRSHLRSGADFLPNPQGQFITRFTYTGRNLTRTRTEAAGTKDEATITYDYTLTGRLRSQSDPRDPRWTTTYTYGGCCDRLLSITDALGYLTSFTYDGVGNRLTTTDPRNNITRQAYDAVGRVIASVDGAGMVTQTIYDHDLTDNSGLLYLPIDDLGFSMQGTTPYITGSAIKTLDPLNNATIVIQDGMGRTVRVINAQGKQTTTVHDQYSVLASDGVTPLAQISVIDPLQRVVSARVDARGMERESVDADGRITARIADGNGNVVSVRDPNQTGWTARYDGHNRLVQRTDTSEPGTTITSGYAYDAQGNVERTTDALSHQTTITYDALQRQETVTDRNQGVTRYTYDQASRIGTITDAEGAVTTYTYDALGLLRSVAYPPGQATPGAQANSVGFTYDGGRRLTTRTDQRGITTAFAYDEAGRIINKRSSDGARSVFAYDAAGRLTRAECTHYGSTIVRSYDLTRLSREDQILDGSLLSVVYGYDDAGRTTRITHPGGTVERTYSTRDALTGATWNSSPVIDRKTAGDFDAGGRLLSTRHGNGVVESRLWRSDNLIRSLSVSLPANATRLVDLQYAYDANRRKTAETDAAIPTLSQQFPAYDDEGRLKDWRRGDGSRQAWPDLSPVGDWRQSTRTVGGVTLTEARRHTSVHEIDTIETAAGATPGTTTLTWDAAGNLVDDGVNSTYGFDADGRLSSAMAPDQEHGIRYPATYRYDALGRRVEKTVYGMATRYIHDGEQVVHEIDAWRTLPSGSPAANSDGTGAGTPPGGAIIPDALVRVNFQPANVSIPDGFVADKGKVLGVRTNGFSYGWDTARTTTVVRNEHPHPQFDTFHQDGTGTPPAGVGTWKITVPNGTYPVALVMGDPSSLDQTDNVTINGVTQTDLSPANTQPPSSSSQRGSFDWFLVNATVTDGAITLTVPTTAKNPKFCFVEIGKAGTAIDQAMRDRASALVGEANTCTGMPRFPARAPTPRSFVYGSYIDEPLMMVANGVKYHYHSNHLYSVAALTDGTGNVVERYKYDAYGRRTVLAADGMTVRSRSSFGNQTGFTGRYHDDETGLVYFRSRYMSTQLGRFVSRDPLGYVDGMGLYGAYFVPMGVDPSGLFGPLGSRLDGGPIGYIPPAYPDWLPDWLKNHLLRRWKQNVRSNLDAKARLEEGGVTGLGGLISPLDVIGPLASLENGIVNVLGKSAKTIKQEAELAEEASRALRQEAEKLAAQKANILAKEVCEGTSRWKPGKYDIDFRGLNKSIQEAIDKAFEKTGLPRGDFTITKWGKSADGKSFPAEWKHKSGAEVSIDWPHLNNGPDIPHVGFQTGGKRGDGGGLRGHILLDTVPYNR